MNVLEQWVMLCELGTWWETKQCENFRIAMCKTCRAARKGTSRILVGAGILFKEWRSLEPELLQDELDRKLLSKFGRVLGRFRSGDGEWTLMSP